MLSMMSVNHWEVDKVMGKDAGRDRYGLLATDCTLLRTAAVWDLSVSARTEYTMQVPLCVFITRRADSENGFPQDREVSTYQTTVKENEHLTQDGRIEKK